MKDADGMRPASEGDPESDGASACGVEPAPAGAPSPSHEGEAAQEGESAPASAFAPATTLASADVSARASESASEERKRRRWPWIAAGLCLLTALALAAAAFLLGNTDDWLEPAAEQGRYEGWDEQAVRDDLDRQVEEGMMAVSISSSIAFDDGQAEGEARIENVPGNRVDQKVVITLDDTGEVLYASKALEPGTHVQRIRLSRDLDPGTYAATAVFTGYDRETHAQRGSAGVQVTLHVLA